MVVLGIVGFFLKATGMPRAPFLIGFVLAIPRSATTTSPPTCTTATAG
jgi:TctA family transporter